MKDGKAPHDARVAASQAIWTKSGVEYHSKPFRPKASEMTALFAALDSLAAEEEGAESEAFGTTH
jgi:hypothetical protein